MIKLLQPKFDISNKWMKQRKTNLKGGSVVISLVVILLIICGLYLGYVFAKKSCSSTVYFSVGNVDRRFKISKSDVTASALEAAQRWNSQSGETLLKYDPSAKLQIELDYDSRQADLDKINGETQNLKDSYQSIEQNKANFETMLDNYQKELSDYNGEVEYWNSKGGADPSTYATLQQKKKQLDSERESLMKLSDSLNLKTNSYNNDLSSLKQEAESRKNLIITQGLYIPGEDKIQIFTFGSKDELRLVLMHELGHSLGLDHDQNSKSIMYYLLSEQDLANPMLTSEDLSNLNSRCDLNQPNFYYHILKFFHLAKSTE